MFIYTQKKKFSSYDTLCKSYRLGNTSLQHSSKNISSQSSQRLSTTWQTALHGFVVNFTYPWKAAILQLLLLEPQQTLSQVSIIYVDERPGLSKWFDDKCSQPGAALCVTVAKCTIGAIIMAICQLSLVTCNKLSEIVENRYNFFYFFFIIIIF